MAIHMRLASLALLVGLAGLALGENPGDPCGQSVAIHRIVTPGSTVPSTLVRGRRGLRYLIEQTPLVVLGPGSADNGKVGTIEEVIPPGDAAPPAISPVPASYTLSLALGSAASAVLNAAESRVGALSDLAVLCGDDMAGLATWVGTPHNRLDVSSIPTRETARAIAHLVARDVREPTEHVVISRGGVGDVRLGDTILELARDLASCDLRVRLARSNSGESVLVLADCGPQLTLVTRLDGAGTVVEVEVTGGTARTSNGFTIGDRVAELIRAMGEPAVHRLPGRACLEFSDWQGLAFCVAEGQGFPLGTGRPQSGPVSPGDSVTSIWVYGKAPPGDPDRRNVD